MSQNPANITNPGSVNAGSEGFGVGPAVPNQPVTVGPGTNPGPVVKAGSFAPGLGVDAPDQAVKVGPSQNAGGLVQGGTASPTSPNVVTSTQNNVVGQVYGSGTPQNVFV
jgi:hypothetical protein